MNPSRARLLLAVISAVLLMAPAFAQGSDSQEPPLILRVSTRLVVVNVIAKDSKGRPVTDLAKDDFILLEEGREQKVDVFSIEANLPGPGTAGSLPPNTFSNRLDGGSQNPRSVTVILLDSLNTPIEDQLYSKRHVIKFLQQLRAEDRVALYVLGSRLGVLHDFTSDARPLLSGLDRYKSRLVPGVSASLEKSDVVGEQLDGWFQGTRFGPSFYFTTDRVITTLHALTAVASHLSRFPGRKNLVWVTAGFPFSVDLEELPPLGRPGRGRVAPFYLSGNVSRVEQTFGAEIELAARALGNANVAVYPVDSRGLMGPFEIDPRLSPADRTDFRRLGPRFGIASDPFDTAWSLATLTGGRAFHNTNDIQGAIRHAIDDSRLTYVLGYYSPQKDWDGRFRKITVKVRRAGVRLRHRRGYFAEKEPVLTPDRRQAVLIDAAISPLDATSLRLTVRVEPANGTSSLKLAMQIDPHDLTLNPEGERWSGLVDVLLAQKGSEGVVLKAEKSSLDLRVDRESYERIIREGVTLTKMQEITPEAAELRVVVRDVASGALGSVAIPLDGYRHGPT